MFECRLFADECGSVLMETVVALPLYLILLGGISWIGDLTLTRQKAAIADRYICWSRANAHASSGFSFDAVRTSLRNGLFGSYSDDHVSIESFALRFSLVPNTWSSASAGVAAATLKMPSWTKGMLATQHVHGSQHVVSLPEEKQLAGRVMQGQGNLIAMWHVMFSRSEYPDPYKPPGTDWLADPDLPRAAWLADPVIWQWIHDEWVNVVDELEKLLDD